MTEHDIIQVPEDGPRYWLNRFPEDSKVLGEGAKQELLKTLFVDFYGLNADDIDFFFKPDLTPNAQDPEQAFRFARIEKQVGELFSGSDGRGDQEYAERHDSFLASYKSILGHFYTQEELEDMVSYMGKGDEAFLVMQLLGRGHYATRRIRNAYLPMITSLIQVGRGDITHTLFDGEGDAVDQLERLVLGPDKSD